MTTIAATTELRAVQGENWDGYECPRCGLCVSAYRALVCPVLLRCYCLRTMNSRQRRKARRRVAAQRTKYGVAQ
jgi:hypothetical protein